MRLPKSPFAYFISFFVIISGLLSLPSAARACTVFKKSEGNTALFGNVENNSPGLETTICFNAPHPVYGGYGNFLLLIGSNVAGGMNDQGLCFDFAGLPEHPSNPGTKPNGDLVRHLLTRCSTVDEALAFFSTRYWGGHSHNHLMVMDKTGASAVVEHIGNKLHVFKSETGTQVMTNFSLADADIRYGDYPCWRYDAVCRMLDDMPLTVSSMQSVCETVSHAYYPALYATVYDPNNLEIHVINANATKECTTFDLLEAFKKGSHTLLLKNNKIISSLDETVGEKSIISNCGPNPFVDEISLVVDLPGTAQLSVQVFDVYGSQVATLGEGQKVPGSYSFSWHASGFPRGIYFCKVTIDGRVETRKWMKQ